MFIPEACVGTGIVSAQDLTHTRSFTYRLLNGKRSSVVSCVCEKPAKQPLSMTLRFNLPCFLNESMWDRHGLCRADVIQCLLTYVSWHLWSLILIENGHIANPALKSSRASADSFIPGGKVLALKRIIGFMDKAKPSSDGDAQAVACSKCKFLPGLKTRPLTQSVMNRPGDTHIPKLPAHTVSVRTFNKLQAGVVFNEGGLHTRFIFTWSNISFVVLQQETHLGIDYLLCSRVVHAAEHGQLLRARLKHRMQPILVKYNGETVAILEESFWVQATDVIEEEIPEVVPEVVPSEPVKEEEEEVKPEAPPPFVAPILQPCEPRPWFEILCMRPDTAKPRRMHKRKVMQSPYARPIRSVT